MYVATSKPSQELATLNRLMGGLGPALEKFEDARYRCGGGSKPYTQVNRPSQVPVLWGYEYLATVPRNSTARVKAMRTKIDGWGPRYTKTVETLAQASSDQFFKLSVDIWNRSQTAEGRKSLATELGVPVDQVESSFKQISALVSTYTGKDFAKFADQVIGSLTEDVLKVLRDLANKIIADTISRSSAEALAEAIPIIGQIFAILLKVAEAANAAKDAEFKAQCQDYLDSLKKAMGDLTKLGLPLPWHIFDLWSPACPTRAWLSDERYVDTPQQAAIRDTFNMLTSQWAKMSVAEVAPVIRWWGLAGTYMSVKRVRDVFETMCFDSLGGTIGSDEQVMVVAAPIAVAYGLDVDALAVNIWDAAYGWVSSKKQAPVSFIKAIYKCPETRWYDPTSWSAAACDLTGGEVQCANVAGNCFVLNLVSMCGVAFDIAERMKKEGVGLYKPPVIALKGKLLTF